jgi:DNA-binding NarL/FixJ family response regulator
MNKQAGIDIDSSDDLYVTNNGTYLRDASFAFRRRARVLELDSQGYNQNEIAVKLQIANGTSPNFLVCGVF